jgi:hypothetical protein
MPDILRIGARGEGRKRGLVLSYIVFLGQVHKTSRMLSWPCIVLTCTLLVATEGLQSSGTLVLVSHGSMQLNACAGP